MTLSEKTQRFLDAMDRRVLIMDGAIGTALLEKGVSLGSGLDTANLTQPGIVQSMHRSYAAAGAQIIETNTFGANRFRLDKHGSSEKVRRINRQGVMLARSVLPQGGFLAGSMGPLGKPVEPIGKVSVSDAKEAFAEQAHALDEAGVDLFILETFSDLTEIVIAVQAIRSVTDEVPIVAMMTFTEEGKTPYGYKPEECARALLEEGAVAIGANCSAGPEHLHEVIERFHRVEGVRIFVAPNAGLPAFVDGRYVYLTGPDYFAEQMSQFADQGVHGVGGCCGTTPEHIRVLNHKIGDRKPVPQDERVRADMTIVATSEQPESSSQKSERSADGVRAKLDRGEYVVSVEIDPPRSINPVQMIQGAAMLRQAGIDAINVADSPLARARMSPLALTTLIRQEIDIETILHMACRDRNILGLQAELMGGHALGVRNILAVTGDPPSVGDHTSATGVFDVDAIGLIGIIRRLNEGVDLSGKPLKFNTDFFIGCASNPTADDLEREIKRFREKEREGVHFTMTQPLYESASLRSFLDETECQVPVLVGILPLRNFRHAEFLHNEVPGMHIPQEIRDRMKAAGDQGPQEGVAIAREFLEEVKPITQGAYLMPPFNRFEMAVQVVDGLV